ncbi:MAG: hypothetical protein Q9228_007541 [Teloschistes exilis]
MSGPQPDQDEAISQFSDLTGVAPSETRLSEADAIIRQDNISKQTSGILEPLLPNTTPHSKKQPTRHNLQPGRSRTL